MAGLLPRQPPSSQPSLAGSDRRVKPCGQLESRGLTPSCLSSVGEVLFRQAERRKRESEREAGSERQIAPESKRDQQAPFCSSRCVINVTLQVESSGNFLCQQALGPAAGFAG